MTRRTLLFLVLAVGTASMPLRATVVVPVSFHDLVTEAALIVRGEVTDVRGVRADAGGIDSIATVAVVDRLKGTAGAFVFVRVPGGVLGRDRFVFVGAPTLRPHDDALFFLQAGADGTWRPLGLSAGVVHVHLDRATGIPMVASPVLAARPGLAVPIVRGDGRRAPVGVATYEAMVRLTMAASTGRRAVPR